MSPTPRKAGAPLARLPRGPHRLSAEAVRESQRARLIRAMLDLVGERGWASTTVPDVVAAAKVSRNAFYELFADKVDCYLAAIDVEVAQLVEAQRPARAGLPWREQLHRGMDVYLRHWQARPLSARAYLVELPHQERAIAQRERAYAAFAADFEGLARLMRKERPDLPPAPPIAIRAVVTAITEEVARDVRAGRLGALHERAAEFAWLVTRLLGDDELAGAPPAAALARR